MEFALDSNLGAYAVLIPSNLFVGAITGMPRLRGRTDGR